MCADEAGSQQRPDPPGTSIQSSELWVGKGPSPTPRTVQSLLWCPEAVAAAVVGFSRRVAHNNITAHTPTALTVLHGSQQPMGVHLISHFAGERKRQDLPTNCPAGQQVGSNPGRPLVTCPRSPISPPHPPTPGSDLRFAECGMPPTPVWHVKPWTDGRPGF